jgi:hypothetical protein
LDLTNEIIWPSVETVLARTFLTVVTGGNFISAAERLHVIQSTVSARIHALEEQPRLQPVPLEQGRHPADPGGPAASKARRDAGADGRARASGVGVPTGYKAVPGGLLLRWLPMIRELRPKFRCAPRSVSRMTGCRTSKAGSIFASGISRRAARADHRASPRGAAGDGLKRGER